MSFATAVNSLIKIVEKASSTVTQKLNFFVFHASTFISQIGLVKEIDRVARAAIHSITEALFGPSHTSLPNSQYMHISNQAPIFERTRYPSDCFSITHGHNFIDLFRQSKTTRFAVYCNGVMNTKYDSVETSEWMTQTVQDSEDRTGKTLYGGFINLYIESKGLLLDGKETAKSLFKSITDLEREAADSYEKLLLAAMQYEVETGIRVTIDHYVHSRGGVNYAHIREEMRRRNPDYERYIGQLYAFGSTYTFPDGLMYWAKGDPVPFLNPINLLHNRDNVRFPRFCCSSPLHAHSIEKEAYKEAFQTAIDQELRAL